MYIYCYDSLKWHNYSPCAVEKGRWRRWDYDDSIDAARGLGGSPRCNNHPRETRKQVQHARPNGWAARNGTSPPIGQHQQWGTVYYYYTHTCQPPQPELAVANGIESSCSIILSTVKSLGVWRKKKKTRINVRYNSAVSIECEILSSQRSLSFSSFLHLPKWAALSFNLTVEKKHGPIPDVIFLAAIAEPLMSEAPLKKKREWAHTL